MTKTHKIVAITVFTLIVVPSIWIGSCAVRFKQYRTGFPKIEVGQPQQTAINLMGNASEVRNCNFPVYDRDRNNIGDCSSIFSYKAPYEQWAIAFDRNGNVLEKYYWFLGEYGNRPPDLD